MIHRPRSHATELEIFMKLLTGVICAAAIGVLSGCVDDRGYQSGGYYSAGAYTSRNYDDRYYRDRNRDFRRDNDRGLDRRWRNDPRNYEMRNGKREYRAIIVPSRR